MEAKKRIGIWVRVSSEYQVRDESPEHHERRARLYAEAKGWEVVEVYRLDAVSGKSVIDHPEAKRMLKDIRSGTISTLIFSKLARLARNTKELLEFADIFRKEQADLVSLAENIDTSSPAGRLFFTIIAAMAEWEREEISSRVAASVPIRASMGKPLGGQASFGYRWEGNNYVPDEKEAPVRKLVYELFIKYKRKLATATELNKLGYRTRNTSEFTDTTVGRLLRDPSAKGERRANYTKSLGDGKKWEMKDSKDWILVPCPAIVSPEVWNECNAILDEQEKKYSRPGPIAKHLLTGFVSCVCGQRMYAVNSNKVYTCKSCKLKIPATDLDEIFHAQLESFLLPDSQTYQAEFEVKLAEKKTLLKSVEEEEERLRKKSTALIELRLSGDISPDLFRAQHKPIETQMLQLSAQIPAIQAEIDFLTIKSMSTSTVLHDAQNLYQQWPELTADEKRAIVEIITEKIVVGKDEIDIVLSHLPQTPFFPNERKSQRSHEDSFFQKPGRKKEICLSPRHLGCSSSKSIFAVSLDFSSSMNCVRFFFRILSSWKAR